MRPPRVGEPVALRSPPMRSRSLVLGLGALLIAACGGSSGDGKESTPKSAPTTAPASPADLKVGDKVTAQGTKLAEPPNPDTRQIDPEQARSEEHTSELQSRPHLVCRLLLEKKKI